jgi:ABC-type antimicrobial peptide transport system permease subunit
VAAQLRATGLPATVTSSADVLGDLVGNPVQAGIKVAFWLAAAAALAFAAIDFLVHLVGAVRERTTQNALVRALGASTRQVGVATAVELAFLVLVGLCFGVAVGELLAHLLVPAITVSPDGSPPAPPVLVSDPWVRVAEFAAGAVAALALGVAGVMSAGRRDAVGSSLRLGED